MCGQSAGMVCIESWKKQKRIRIISKIKIGIWNTRFQKDKLPSLRSVFDIIKKNHQVFRVRIYEWQVNWTIYKGRTRKIGRRKEFSGENHSTPTMDPTNAHRSEDHPSTSHPCDALVTHWIEFTRRQIS